MKARDLVFRIAMAAAATAATVAVAAPAAHAAVPQSATVSLECDPIAGSQWKAANWHVHLSLAGDTPYGYSFLVVTDMNVPQPHYLLPGTSVDLVVPGRDGLGSKITVAADNYVLEKISTVVCNPPLANIFFSCTEDGWPSLTYYMNNPSPSTYNFTVHESGGVDLTQQLTANSKSIIQNLSKGTSYQGSIAINGTTLAELAGVATCEEVVIPTTTTTLPPTTTTTAAPVTTTTLAPTTTTTVPPETTTVEVDDPTPTTTVPATREREATTTTSVVVSSHTAPSTAAPTTTVPVAASANDTLPFTGGNAMPLVALGSALVGLGILLTGRRRRAIQ